MIKIETIKKSNDVAVHSNIEGGMVDVTMEIVAILNHLEKHYPIELTCAIEYRLFKGSEEKDG